MFRKLAILLVSLVGTFATGVFAVGLGEIKQSSGLNQPLQAEIPLLSAGDLAEYEVLATLASNSDFEKFGVERLFFLNKIKFVTARNANDEIVIKVSTHDPIKEPFLNFLVELNWPNGRILREYTLLLDPPVFEKHTSSTIEKTKTSTPPPQAVRRPTQTRAESSTPRSAYEPQESYSGSTYGPVSSTDTLWSIASRVRPDRSVSIQQTLVAIYRANPDAFGNGNINYLLKGKVLNIPDANAIQNVPKRAALQDVVMQNRQWKSGGARQIVDRTGDEYENRDTGSRGSRLSLAASDGDGDAQGYGSDATEINKIKNELNRSQEEAATLLAENEALRSRLAEILEKAEKGGESSVVDVDDAELAVLASNDTDEQSDSSDSNENESQASEPSTPENSNATPEGAENSQGNTLASNDVQSNSEDSSVANTGEEAKVSEVQEGKTAPKKPAVVVAPKKKEQSLVDELMAGGTLTWSALGGLVIIIMLVVFWRMKKRMEDEEFQDDLVASAGAGSMDTTESFELPDVGDDMLVELDMDDGEADGEDASDEAFDPIGEADIYIAYGKHEQAETLLLDAIEDNPIRSDYKVKLMECYAESDNREKFESLAKEVSEAVDADEWNEQVSNLRKQAWSDENDIDDDDFDLPSTEDIFGDDAKEGLDEELDIDFEEESLESNGDITSKESVNDFDGLDDGLDDLDELDGLDELDSLDSDNSQSTVAEDNIDSLDDVDSLDDIEDLDNLDSDENDNSNDEAEFSLDDEMLETDDDISLDIDDDFDFSETSSDDDLGSEFDDALGEESDEIATKLDLARAYVDMGDAEGAREILTEVVAEGNEEQKAEAQDLLDKNS